MRITSLLVATLLLLSFILAGCTTVVPVKSKFPEPPGKMSLEKCPNLQKLQEDAKLSDVARTVTLNYTTYYECAIKSDAGIEWYNVQKHIYENIN